MSVAIENFVKAIYKNKINDVKNTKPGNIAKLLGISNAAATDMAKSLASKNLLNYEKYKALKLTKTGEKLALNVIRKHRLWEAFLHKTFEMSLDRKSTRLNSSHGYISYAVFCLKKKTKNNKNKNKKGGLLIKYLF